MTSHVTSSQSVTCASVADWPPLEDSERLEKVRRFHQLRESRDKAMLRQDLIGYEKLRESAKSKTVGGRRTQHENES